MSNENNDGDEELMSDFQDLFEEEAGDTASGLGPADESLDELDAFLDDFEKNLDVPDAAAQEGDRSDRLELDKEALDLDVGLDGEVYAEEPVLDEAEESIEEALAESAEVEDDLLELDAMMDEAQQSSAADHATAGEQEELVLETPAPEPIAAATTAAAAAAAATPSITPPPGPAISRGQMIAGATVLGASLLLSVSALWMGMSLGTQIETLNESVGELQQRVMAQSRRGSLSAPAQVGEQLNQLGQRVSELAVIVEGPVGHLRERNQQALEALSQRLDRLEKGQSKVAVTASVKESKPLVTKAKATPVAAPVETRAPAKRGWVINLLSVTSAKTANEELARLRKMGIRADKQTVSKDGKSWYRLRVTGFDSYEGAKAYIDTVEKQTGFKSAWVAKQ